MKILRSPNCLLLLFAYLFKAFRLWFLSTALSFRSRGDCGQDTQYAWLVAFYKTLWNVCSWRLLLRPFLLLAESHALLCNLLNSITLPVVGFSKNFASRHTEKWYTETNKSVFAFVVFWNGPAKPTGISWIFSIHIGSLATYVWVSRVPLFLPDSEHCGQALATAITSLWRCCYHTLDMVASNLLVPDARNEENA